MRRLHGFKYCCESFKYVNADQIILRTQEGRTYLDCVIHDKIFVKDITEHLDYLCEQFCNYNFNQWDGMQFDSPTEIFPGCSWSVVVETDEVVCRCSGVHTWPMEPLQLILKSIGITIV